VIVGLRVLAEFAELSLHMPIYEPDSCSCCLLVFLSGAIWQGELAISQELPDAPSVGRNACFSPAERSDAASGAPKSPETGSLDSSDSKFLRRWPSVEPWVEWLTYRTATAVSIT
jgi:hypothetical protein